MAARADTGDPMDVAILAAAPRLAAGAIASFPFTEDRRRETGIFRTESTLVAAAKGAPEVILALCELDGPARQQWLAETAALAAGGHKVIAVAERELDPGAWPGGEPDRGFRFAGLIAFEDPLRDGVREALDACRTAGIRVIMVTGDHPVTARAIAEGIGLREGQPGIIEGSELERRLDAGQEDALLGVDVVARAAPAQKLRLVRELQARGEIVAVTGDGVNDVPALQAADIGIAMGGRGTRSAREVAAIVLLDDNFRSIVRAIAEGRQLFSNLRLSFEYLLMIHLPLVVTAAAIPLAGYPLLYLPIHIVWLELLIHPTAMLVFQSLPSERRPLRQKRRLREVRFFDRAEWLLIVLTGAGITLVVLGSYVRSLGAGYEVEHARTMALVALTLANAGVTAALSRLRDRPAVWMVGLTAVLAVVFVQVPWLAGRLHLQPLHADDWLIAVLGGLAAGLLPYLAGLWRNRP
jgi:Ca2+-transporting ATPase